MYRFKFYLKRIVTFILTSASMTGCMVGPDFHSPHNYIPPRYTQKPLPKKTASTPHLGSAGKSQKYVEALDIPASWWYLFHSTDINRLVQHGLVRNPNLQAAEAALLQSQEILSAQIGNLLWPGFNGQFNAQRQRFSNATLGAGTETNIFNIFNTSVNVAYNLDVFGGSRRLIEAYRAQVDYQQYQVIAAYLTLTSNIVTTAISIASFEAQIISTRELIKIEENQLRLIRKQFRLGGVAITNVLTQQTLLEQTKSTLPPLQNNLSQAKHALAILMGEYPNYPVPTIHLNALNLPKRLPVSLPSSLILQRPDIQAQEALLHVASAQIGVATANLLPNISISGNYGWTNEVLSQLIQPANITWSMGASVLQPFFHGGALIAQRRAAIAAYQQACAQYREVLLQAFKNVADSLRALETDARALRAARSAEVAAKKSLNISQQQFFLGAVSYLTLLIAQQQYEQTMIVRIRAEATRFSDTVALYQALGGGWWHVPCLACKWVRVF